MRNTKLLEHATPPRKVAFAFAVFAIACISAVMLTRDPFSIALWPYPGIAAFLMLSAGSTGIIVAEFLRTVSAKLQAATDKQHFMLSSAIAAGIFIIQSAGVLVALQRYGRIAL